MEWQTIHYYYAQLYEKNAYADPNHLKKKTLNLYAPISELHLLTTRRYHFNVMNSQRVP